MIKEHSVNLSWEYCFTLLPGGLRVKKNSLGRVFFFKNISSTIISDRVKQVQRVRECWNYMPRVSNERNPSLAALTKIRASVFTLGKFALHFMLASCTVLRAGDQTRAGEQITEDKSWWSNKNSCSDHTEFVCERKTILCTSRIKPFFRARR